MEEPREHQWGAGKLHSRRGRGDGVPQGLASSPRFSPMWAESRQSESPGRGCVTKALPSSCGSPGQPQDRCVSGSAVRLPREIWEGHVRSRVAGCLWEGTWGQGGEERAVDLALLEFFAVCVPSNDP